MALHSDNQCIAIGDAPCQNFKDTDCRCPKWGYCTQNETACYEFFQYVNHDKKYKQIGLYPVGKDENGDTIMGDYLPEKKYYDVVFMSDDDDIGKRKREMRAVCGIRRNRKS